MDRQDTWQLTLLHAAGPCSAVCACCGGAHELRTLVVSGHGVRQHVAQQLARLRLRRRRRVDRLHARHGMVAHRGRHCTAQSCIHAHEGAHLPNTPSQAEHGRCMPWPPVCALKAVCCKEWKRH